ncbi:putative G-type lectin S-receptor-like serine/threonine-protein kinase-like [Capsicum annuum]|uniref:F-box associated beta-propeller type 3 domain-containing protein n=1 Tax=Capsicum annuum TaxID=4072 RepID=A0A2G3A2S9_CAPAN|nr:putative G-type lectin S-receptor-like serine/threonine-protein kinase-like [Capsicum annuum]PHT88533.1 hypothetical protein T459_10639 [Capsicum annuum]
MNDEAASLVDWDDNGAVYECGAGLCGFKYDAVRCGAGAPLPSLRCGSSIPYLESTSPASFIINQFGTTRTGSRTNTLRFLKFVVDNSDHEICHDPNVDLDLLLHFPVYPFFLVGSVHGFVCFNYFYSDVDSINILNPRSREHIILPEAQGVRKWPNLVTCGFGFDPVRFEYKVVRIYQEEIRDDTNNSRYYKSEAQVYTIGKGYWRHVVFCFGCRASGVNLYGKLHWKIVQIYEVWEFLGIVYVCGDNNTESNFEVRVMKEYGVPSSWIKEIVINTVPRCNDWLCYEMINPLHVLEDGETLFLWRDDFLFLHHPVKRTLKKLDVCEGNFLTSAHIWSSFSLKSFEEEVVNLF